MRAGQKKPEPLPRYIRLQNEWGAIEALKAEQKELEKLLPPKRVPDVTELPRVNISAVTKRNPNGYDRNF